MLDSMASAPPFTTYTRPDPQRSLAMEQQMEEQALSVALAASLRDHHQQQQQHSQRHQQQRVDVRPRARIDVEAVSGAVQVRACSSRLRCA
jgi:hypothetical protein